MHSIVTHSKNNIRKPIAFHALTTLDNIQEIVLAKKALNYLEWHKEM